jgi:hypothetical protein
MDQRSAKQSTNKSFHIDDEPKIRFRKGDLSNLRQSNLKLHESSLQNLKSITDNKTHLFSIENKNLEKENSDLFKIFVKENNGSTDVSSPNIQRNKISHDFYKNQNKHFKLDSSFSSKSDESEEEEEDEGSKKDLKTGQITPVKIQKLELSVNSKYPDIDAKIEESNNLCSFFLFQFGDRAEAVEIPKCFEEQNRAKLYNNLYKTGEKSIRDSRLSSNNSRQKYDLYSREKSEGISRNFAVGASGSMETHSQQRKREFNPLIEKPIRSLREVFKSIKKEIRNNKKLAREESASVSSEEEKSIEDGGSEGEYELEMDNAQRKKLETRLMDVIK